MKGYLSLISVVGGRGSKPVGKMEKRCIEMLDVHFRRSKQNSMKCLTCIVHVVEECSYGEGVHQISHLVIGDVGLAYSWGLSLLVGPLEQIYKSYQ